MVKLKSLLSAIDQAHVYPLELNPFYYRRGAATREISKPDWSE